MPLNMVIPVGTGASVGTGVTTYSGLLTTIGDWLNRSDLVTKIPDFITLLEARLNRILRVPEMEDTVDLDAADIVDLPTDFLEVRSLTVDTTPRLEMTQAPLAQIESYYEVDASGVPAYYAISDGAFKLGPEPSDGFTLRLAYYKKIIALSADNETNWLIVSHPDIYLWGALLMAETFIWDDPRIPLWKAAWDEALSELMVQGRAKRHGGALSTRIPNAA